MIATVILLEIFYTYIFPNLLKLNGYTQFTDQSVKKRVSFLGTDT